MTQHVTLENGEVHSFPDDATQDEMTQALASAAPSPPQMPTAENFGNAVMKGYGQLGTGILGLGPQIGSSLGLESPEQAASEEQTLSGGKQELGNEYPTTPGIVASIGQGLGQTAPAMLIPGVGIPSAIAGGMSALSNTDPTEAGGTKATNAAIAAPLFAATGIAGNKVLQGLGALGAKAWGAANGASTPVLDAYAEAGVTPTLAGDVTGSPFLKSMQAYADKSPSVLGASEKTINEFGDSIENTAAQMGGSHTLQEAGQAVQDSGKKWLSNFQTQSGILHDAVNDAVGSDTPVPLSKTAQIYQDLQSKSANNPAIQSFLSSPLMKQFGQITDTATDGAVPWETSRALKSRVGQYLENPDLIADAGGAQAKQLYGALAQDQKAAIQPAAIEEHFQNKWNQASQDTAEAQKELAGANSNMTQLQAAKQTNSSVYAPNANDEMAAQNAIDAAQQKVETSQQNKDYLLNEMQRRRGLDPQQLFNTANAYTTQGHQYIDNVLGDVLKKGTQPSDVAANLLSSGVRGGETLSALRQNMPDAANELGAISIRRMGAGQSEGAAGNGISPDRWLSNQDPTRRLSPEARNALFPDPAIQSKMKALDTVASTIKDTASYVNRSRTAGTQEVQSWFKAPRDIGLSTLAGHEFGGVPGAVAGGALATLPYISRPAASALSTTPALTRFLAMPSPASPLGTIPSRVIPSALAAYAAQRGQ